MDERVWDGLEIYSQILSPTPPNADLNRLREISYLPLKFIKRTRRGILKDLRGLLRDGSF